jgi:hypothetical protein
MSFNRSLRNYPGRLLSHWLYRHPAVPKGLKRSQRFVPLALMALALCTTPFNAQVSRFQDFQPQGQTFIIRNQ